MIGGTALLLAELAALFFGVSFAIHLVQRRAGTDRLRQWMGGRPTIAALKGIAVGFATPFCTYSAIPLLVGFRQAGVPPAGYVAFIVAAPVLDPILFGALVLIVGLHAALLYVAITFGAAMVLAQLAERVDMERHLKPLPEMVGARPRMVGPNGAEIPVDGPVGETCRPGEGLAHVPWRGLRAETPRAARASAALLRDLAPLMLVGVGIGVAITAFVSPDMTVAATSAAGPLSVPISAAMGTPLYFNTELFVPIADALRSAGLGPGPIVALTIAGAGANLPEFVILGKLARGRALVAFVTYVFAVAMVGGLIAQTVTS